MNHQNGYELCCIEFDHDFQDYVELQHRHFYWVSATENKTVEKTKNRKLQTAKIVALRCTATSASIAELSIKQGYFLA